MNEEKNAFSDFPSERWQWLRDRMVRIHGKENIQSGMLDFSKIEPHRIEAIKEFIKEYKRREMKHE